MHSSWLNNNSYTIWNNISTELCNRCWECDSHFIKITEHFQLANSRLLWKYYIETFTMMFSSSNSKNISLLPQTHTSSIRELSSIQYNISELIFYNSSEHIFLSTECMLFIRLWFILITIWKIHQFRKFG